MTLDQSALPELNEMMQSADRNDLMRPLLGSRTTGRCAVPFS
jgi:hypothetical protein